MPRKQHDYHFIYKTTNLVNEQFYIGMHSTSNLEDGYIGSGKRLKYSIKKYGRENFKMEILEFLVDRKSLRERERELINSDLLKEELCINLQVGGSGGFSCKEHEKLAQSNGGRNSIYNLKAASEKHSYKLKTDDNYRLQYSKTMSIAQSGEKNGFFGKKHSIETLELMRKKETQIGEKNSQYGSCWITNGLENKKIKKGDLITEGWRLGRKMNNCRGGGMEDTTGLSPVR